MENERAEAGGDGRSCPLPVELTAGRIGNHTRLILYQKLVGDVEKEARTNIGP